MQCAGRFEARRGDEIGPCPPIVPTRLSGGDVSKMPASPMPTGRGALNSYKFLASGIIADHRRSPLARDGPASR